jgi:hypothetical protein
MCALQALPLHRPVGLVLVEPEVPLQYLDAVKRFAYLQQRPLNPRADFADGKPGAGDVAERVEEGGDALILDEELRDDGNALRSIDQRLGKLLPGDRVGLRGADVDGLRITNGDAVLGCTDIKRKGSIGSCVCDHGVERGF